MAARSIRNVLTTTLAIGLLGLTAQGGAAIEAWNEEAVRFADLNMSSQAGVTTLYKRLEDAARRVCSDRKNQWIENLMDRNRYPACVAEAMDNAVISVDQPGLTAEHLAHTRTRTRAAPAVR